MTLMVPVKAEAFALKPSYRKGVTLSLRRAGIVVLVVQRRPDSLSVQNRLQ